MISRSDLVKGKILEIKHVQRLHKILSVIESSSTVQKWKKQNCCADVEFIIFEKEKDFQIVILQIRPHSINL